MLIITANVESVEFVCGNIVRRVLGIIRESAQGDNDKASFSANSMFELLSDKPAQSNIQDSNTSKTRVSKDAKADIIEGIQELIDEISNIEETVSGLSVDMIHEK